MTREAQIEKLFIKKSEKRSESFAVFCILFGEIQTLCPSVGRRNFVRFSEISGFWLSEQCFWNAAYAGRTLYYGRDWRIYKNAEKMKLYHGSTVGVEIPNL